MSSNETSSPRYCSSITGRSMAWVFKPEGAESRSSRGSRARCTAITGGFRFWPAEWAKVIAGFRAADRGTMRLRRTWWGGVEAAGNFRTRQRWGLR